MDDFLSMLSDLCRIDSRSSRKEGIRDVMALLTPCLEERDFTVRIQELKEGDVSFPVLDAVRGSSDGQVLLLGHADTVLGPQEVPFRIGSQPDRIYGAGVADMKGGLTVLLQTLDRTKKRNLRIVVNGREEIPTQAFRNYIRRNLKAEYCLNFEPVPPADEGLYAVTARKGLRRFKLESCGKAAHAGNDHASGVSAVRGLCGMVEKLESMTDYGRECTVNVGIVRGGSAYNQVPDYAEAEFEIRAFELDVLESAVRKAEELVNGSGTRCKFVLTPGPAFPAFSPNSGTEALFRKYGKCAERKGVRVFPISRGGASDSSYVADLVPVLDGLGPVGGRFHSDEEWALTASFVQKAEIAGEFLNQF
ncbi:MAG: M20/M25/M40 family metallo-hydrolase [Spirochaetia bacterium]